MDPLRLRIWEWLTGLAGAVLLALMFLDWYEGHSAWAAFSVLDVMLAIIALMGLAATVMAAAHNTPAVSLAIVSLLLTIGAITTIAVIVRAIVTPDGLEREIGLWLGLAASALVTGGALGCMRDERFPRAARANVPVETLPPPEGGKA